MQTAAFATSTRGARIIYLIVVLGIAAWRFLPRPWKPSVVFETNHYIIESSADRGQTEEISRVVEMLCTAYSDRFGNLRYFQHEHPASTAKRRARCAAHLEDLC